MVVPFALVRLQQDTLDAIKDPTFENVWPLTFMIVPYTFDMLQQDTLDAMRDPMLERV